MGASDYLYGHSAPEGDYIRLRSRRCTFLTGRHLPAKVRLDSAIGCNPEWS
jgi:hypothetical protein